MKGFTRIPVEEFEDYNAQALARLVAVTGDVSMERYSYSIPDADPLYCWIRQEPRFTEIMTPDELSTVKTESEAVALGMVRDGSQET